jgi:stage III sporulation protein SpoIIIAA
MKLSEADKRQNAAIITNAVELGANVIKKVAGNEIADTVDGASLSDVLHTAVAAKIKSKLAKRSGGKYA